jgi:hypothetical protein
MKSSANAFVTPSGEAELARETDMGERHRSATQVFRAGSRRSATAHSASQQARFATRAR